MLLPSPTYQIGEVSLDYLFASTVVQDLADELSKGFHGVYANSDDIEKEWGQLPFLLKESDRDLADHLAIKARYAGVDADTFAECIFNGRSAISNADRKLMEEKRDDLVLMEMRRYRAFMFMNDFTHGTHSTGYHVEGEKDGKELNCCLRLNNTLLQESLPKIEVRKDEDIVVYSMTALEK
jgi:hypothetical protein